MITISVCVGSACHLKGSYSVISALQAMIAERNLSDRIELKGVFCLKHCTKGVSVMIDDDENSICSVTPDTVAEFLENEILPKLG